MHSKSNTNDMAKGHAFFGKIRGRIGGAVYRVQNGIQVISEYNPNPLNPKSNKQIVHRAKFSCCSAFSSLLPYAAIAGYSPKPDMARSALMKNLMASVEVDVSDPTDIVAWIVPEKVVLSDGRKISIEDFQTAQGVDPHELQVEFNISPDAGVDNAIVVAVVFDKRAQAWTGSVVHVIDGITTSGEYVAKFDVGIDLTTTNALISLYAIPIVDYTTYVRTVYGREVKLTTNGDYSTEVLRALSKRDMFCSSVFLGTYDTRQ